MYDTYEEEKEARSFAAVRDIAEFLEVPQVEVRLAFAHARQDCKSDPETREQFGTKSIRA